MCVCCDYDGYFAPNWALALKRKEKIERTRLADSLGHVQGRTYEFIFLLNPIHRNYRAAQYHTTLLAISNVLLLEIECFSLKNSIVIIPQIIN